MEDRKSPFSRDTHLKFTVYFQVIKHIQMWKCLSFLPSFWKQCKRKPAYKTLLNPQIILENIFRKNIHKWIRFFIFMILKYNLYISFSRKITSSKNSVWSHFPKQTFWRNIHVSQNLSNFILRCLEKLHHILVFSKLGVIKGLCRRATLHLWFYYLTPPNWKNFYVYQSMLVSCLQILTYQIPEILFIYVCLK